jgi:amino acid transporter
VVRPFVRRPWPGPNRDDMSTAGLHFSAEAGPPAHSPKRPARTTWPPLAARLKLLLLGRPLESSKLHRTLLPKVLALPVFSSDALSSVAYATQEILLVLGAAGVGALSLVTPISGAVAVLFVVVVVSYRQTVHAYPSGGGAYRVAHENLGVYPGLLAAAALLIDYVLTVSVSVVAGTDSLISAAPALGGFRLPMSLLLLSVIALANLRGVRESALMFSIPTYGFVASMYVLILGGAISCLGGCPQAPSSGLHPAVTESVSIFLLLKAFASGTTALTGVEAISNGVPAFREPRSQNAATTLTAMGVLAVSMFVGISWLAHVTHVVYTQNSDLTAVAQVADAVFGRGPMFFVLQIMTAAILVLAANTAYQDFPRLSSILAADDYMPHALKNRGDRLVFSNGIVTLSFLAAGLLVLFNADLSRLIQLYLIGVFVSFTLSQSGMVVRWRNTREAGWRRRATANAVGALVTGMVLLVVLTTKFMDGAWMVAVATPVVILAMRSMHKHYERVGKALSVPHQPLAHETPNRAVVLLEKIDAAAVVAVAHARAIPGATVSAAWMGSGPIDRGLWETVAPDVEVVESARDAAALSASLSQLGGQTTALATFVSPLVVDLSPIPHIVAPSYALRQTARSALKSGNPVQLMQPIVHDAGPAARDRLRLPFVGQVCVLVPSLNAPSLRAIEFARRLGADVRAAHIALDPAEAERLADAWRRQQMNVPLDLHEAPFRHFGASLVEYITDLQTEDSDETLMVVVPEVIMERRGRGFLDSHTIRAVRRALLPLTGIAIVTVPFPVAGPERQIRWGRRMPTLGEKLARSATAQE